MKRFIAIIMTILSVSLSASAQDIKFVTGTIYDKSSGRPIDVSNVEVEVYGYNTVAGAMDQKMAMEAADFNEVVVAADYIGTIDRNGYYMVNVASTGAILFKIGIGGNTIVLEEVNNRLSIDISVHVENYLQAAVTSAERLEIGAIDPQSDIEGNYLYLTSPYSIPSNTAKTNMRMILQPVLLFADKDGNPTDTIQFLKTQVIDGEEYSKMQTRKMGFDRSNDPLTPYVDSLHHLSKYNQTFVWMDTVYIDDPMKNYVVMGNFQFEDYTRIYEKKPQRISSMRPRRPTRFLEIDVAPYVLDPRDFPESPKRERFNVEEDISITFNVGKSTFDRSDELTVQSLSTLRSTLLGVIEGEGSQLKEFHISCVASPDGIYDQNVQLAENRMKNAIQEIQSYIPARIRERVYWTTNSRVAGWEEVAVMLEEDGKIEEAEHIRKITSTVKDQSLQSRKIQNFPEYRSVIVDYLPKLRSVHYSYAQEIFRNPTGEDILNKYHNDPDYRSGIKKFTLYEYWMLFQLLDDETELEEVYVKANKAHIESFGKPWILPSNALAVAAISRGEIDTTILAPFVDYTVKNTDVHIHRSYGDEIINPEAVVANQMIMYMMARNFTQSSRLSQILKDNEKNNVLKSYAMALGGYYKGGKTPEEIERSQRIFSIIENTSPFNKVVINLAMRMRKNDIIAENTLAECEAVAKDDHDRAMIQYFWAVLYQRKFQATNDIMADMERQDRLVECFKIDKSFIDIAAVDGDIDNSIFQAARDLYQLQQ